VDVYRGGELESRHRVHAVVVGLASGEEARFGDPTCLTYWRSSMKPFQALPLTVDGADRALEMDARELALCCASHVGSPEHVRTVSSLLSRLGLGEEDLACGPHAPFDDDAAREVVRSGEAFSRLHNNCSGKHAGMLALALHHGWPTAGYEDPGHPVQERIRRELDEWLDVDAGGLAWGTDGCGVPTAYLSLRQMARAFGRLGRASRGGHEGAARVVSAMTTHPELVSGPGRPVTRIMEASGGRVLAKEGAEGVTCLADPGAGWGLALKVSDGARRGATPAALEALATLALLPEEEMEELDDLRCPAIDNTRGETVGRIRARMEVRTAATAPGP
jgi:L-asparaginase II